MLSLAEVVEQHTTLSEADTAHLVRLTQHWTLLADLSFSDLILWVPDVDPQIFWAAAQVRPTTGPTALEDDVVGEELAYEVDSLVMEAFLSGEIAHTTGNKLHAGIPVDQQAIPICRDGRVIAVVELHTNRMGVRAPGALEENYLETAELLCTMVWAGDFPTPGEPPVPWISPRPGDGLLRVDPDGQIVFASPNGVSSFRRLGVASALEGDTWSDLLQALPREAREPLDEAVSGRLKRVVEVDVEARAGSLHLRVQPLLDHGHHVGLLVLCRDTTELRQRERQLVTKDATIREIHHRVKNNLQTVSALLRLQARRTDSPDAREALTDAQRRVSAISVVHEILSRAFDGSVDFDDVADRLLGVLRELSGLTRVTVRRSGSFGPVPAAAATNLSLVLNEIILNAMEHGLAERDGLVTVDARQEAGTLYVDVTNDGESLPEGFDPDHTDSLGLSIVATLVADLHGTFDLTNRTSGVGTVARLVIPLS